MPFSVSKRQCGWHLSILNTTSTWHGRGRASANGKRPLPLCGIFLDLEQDTRVRQRLRALFKMGMAPVEPTLTRTMTAQGMPLEETSAATQTWWEFSVATGRRQ
jgi:hypothetical protein